jgi:integrase
MRRVRRRWRGPRRLRIGRNSWAHDAIDIFKPAHPRSESRRIKLQPRTRNAIGVSRSSFPRRESRSVDLRSVSSIASRADALPRAGLQRRPRDLALFNLAIDSKLRGCDVVALRVEDVAPHAENPICTQRLPKQERYAVTRIGSHPPQTAPGSPDGFRLSCRRPA